MAEKGNPSAPPPAGPPPGNFPEAPPSYEATVSGGAAGYSGNQGMTKSTSNFPLDGFLKDKM